MLYICPTSIGNLQDVTLRVLEVLGKADLVACEDTRHTGVLLRRHGVVPNRLVSFHEHNEEQRIEKLLPLLREGKDVAIVSDAGMPGLSDPGFSLVRACVAEEISVTVLPGPSAVSTALVLSGLPVDRFAFVGFLARGRAKLVEQLARFDGTGATLVGFESPRRVRSTLGAIAERWPQRRLALCRELTKVHEEAIRGTAREVLDRLPDAVRGEIVLVMAPAGEAGSGPVGEGTVTRSEVEERARWAMSELQSLGVGTKKAAGIVAALTGLPARRVYELGLEMAGDR